MKKILVFVLVLAMMCMAALAEPTVNVENGNITIGIEGQDWTVSVEDENVLTVSESSYDEASNTESFVLTAVAPGYSAVEFSNGDENCTLSMYVDADNNIEILPVEEDAEAAEDAVEVEISADDTVVTFRANGVNWSAYATDTAVLDLLTSEQNDEEACFAVSFLAVGEGISDVILSDEVNEYVYTVYVNEEGKLQLIDTTESDVNETFDTMVKATIENGILTVTLPGEWNFVIDKTDVLEDVTYSYDEATGEWTGSFMGKEDGVAEITFTNGSVTGTIDATVYEGQIDSFRTNCEEELDTILAINPNGYHHAYVYEVFEDEEGGTFMLCTLGEIIGEGDEIVGFDGFGAKNVVFLDISDDAVITMPTDITNPEEMSEIENFAEYINAAYALDPEYEFYVGLEMNADGEVTSMTCLYVN